MGSCAHTFGVPTRVSAAGSVALFVAAAGLGYDGAVSQLVLSSSHYRAVFLPAAVALFAGALLLCELDPAGSYPGWPQGPGLTTDEVFNVQEGVRLLIAVPGFLSGRLTLREAFGDADEGKRPPNIGFHLADHPPLGRLWIGTVHQLVRRLFPPRDHNWPWATACARVAPATAFMVTILVVGGFTSKWYGGAAGLIASLSLVLMPRVFGHAHLAALETFIGLMYSATVLTVAHFWVGRQAPGWKTACLTGALLGLALLTKIQAILLPLPVAAWAVWHWRARAIKPLVLWSLAGLVVFVVGWPWLWLDPLGHFAEYFGRTAHRARLYTFYFGTKYADVEVPWHYPWLLFAVTVPVGLQLLGAFGLYAGLISRRTDEAAFSSADRKTPAAGENRPPSTSGSAAAPEVVGPHNEREQLLAACLLFPLLVFSLPGVAVYDGARLFLVSFPLWAVFVARGGAAAFGWLRRRVGVLTAAVLLSVWMAGQSYGLIAVRPCYLSYYNLLVGGLPGAERLGLEVNYWGDGLTRDLLAQSARLLPRGTTVELVPVLYAFAPDELERQSPILRRREIRLTTWRESAPGRRFVLLFRRRADLPPPLQQLPPEVKRLAATIRQGVVLAALYEIPPSESD